MRHAARALEVPLSHWGPFDGLLSVQAQEADRRLLTAGRLSASCRAKIAVEGRHRECS